MSLPEWVKAECRKEIRKPTKSMQDRADRVREAAYRCGYLYDFEKREYIYVGEGPEPRTDPRPKARSRA